MLVRIKKKCANRIKTTVIILKCLNLIFFFSLVNMLPILIIYSTKAFILITNFAKQQSVENSKLHRFYVCYSSFNLDIQPRPQCQIDIQKFLKFSSIKEEGPTIQQPFQPSSIKLRDECIRGGGGKVTHPGFLNAINSQVTSIYKMVAILSLYFIKEPPRRQNKRGWTDYFRLLRFRLPNTIPVYSASLWGA